MSEYPYDLGDKLIHEIYKEEFADGGSQIDMVFDAGELHYLLGRFWYAINKTQEGQGRPQSDETPEKVVSYTQIKEAACGGCPDASSWTDLES